MEVPKDSFDVTFDGRASPISKTGSLLSSGSNVVMCPLVVGLTGSSEGFTGARVPAGRLMPLDVFFREQFALLANSFSDITRGVIKLSLNCLFAGRNIN